MNWKNLAAILLSTFTRCVACDLEAASLGSFPLCATCESSLLPGINSAKSLNSDYVGSSYSLFQRTDSGYPVLKKWKTRRGPVFDHRVLKHVTLVSLREYLNTNQIQAIVPVPQSYRRSWKMSGSPALRIATFVSKVGNIPVQANLLKRSAKILGKRQAELPGWQRQQTRLLFSAHKNRQDFKSILVVDDFSTTGHTLDEAARSLREAGFPKVHALCLCAKSREHLDHFGPR